MKTETYNVKISPTVNPLGIIDEGKFLRIFWAYVAEVKTFTFGWIWISNNYLKGPIEKKETKVDDHFGTNTHNNLPSWTPTGHLWSEFWPPYGSIR